MMKIIEVIEPKNKKDDFKIIFEDESEYSISKEVFFKRNFSLNEDVDIDILNELIKNDKKLKAREIALSYLDRGLKSKYEIEKKLLEKGIDKDIIEETILNIQGYGYIDDTHLTKVYIEDKLFNRGKIRIKNELLKKGIDKNTIEEVFGEEYKQRELETLEFLAKRKYDSLKKRNEDDYKLKEKLIRFLLSKGYEYDLIKKVLDNIISNSYEVD